MDSRAESSGVGKTTMRVSAEEILECAPDAVIVSDPDGGIVFANAEAEKVFGYSRAELAAMAVEHLIPARLRKQHRRHRQRYASKPVTRRMGSGARLVGLRRDGSEFPVDVSLSAVRAGRGVLITSFIRDVSEARRMEQHLELSHVALNSLDSHVLVLDASGVVIGVNDAWKRFAIEASSGSVMDGGIGHDGFALCRRVLHASTEESASLLDGLESALDGSQTRFMTEYRANSAAGERWFLVKVTALSGPRRGAVLYHTDITQRKLSEQMLRERARRDALTDVFNHGALADLLRAQLADGAGQRVAVAMIDIDGMKEINDTYGHGVGDDALIAVSRAASTQGAIVGRYGGDEFVAILPGADRAAAVRYRGAVLDNLANTPIVDAASGTDVPLSASIGFAVYPEEARSAAEVLRLADAAMYSSRRHDRAQGNGNTRPLAVERLAEAIREITVLLPLPGEAREKLRLVAHRVSICAGYDLVAIELFADALGIQADARFSRLPGGVPRTFYDDCLRIGGHVLRPVLERGRQQVHLDHPAEDERLTPRQRAGFDAAGLRSVMLVPVLEQDRLVGVLTAASRHPAAFGARDGPFLSAVATQIVAITRMSILVDDLRTAAEDARQAHTQTVMMLAAAAEAHDHTTGVHLRNVRALVEALARELGYTDHTAAELGLAAVLHDIGKIRVPKEILLSPDELSATEWAVVKQHAAWGAEFLAGRPAYALAAAVAQHHHERWDGQGYPAGLRGHQIPQEATIVAVADAFDSMTHDRPYRQALPAEDAIGRIAAASGTQFSPEVVRALVRLHDRRLVAIECDARPRRAA